MRGLFVQSLSALQVMVQMLGLSMTVRGSGETARQVNSDTHSDDCVQGKPKSPG